MRWTNDQPFTKDVCQDITSVLSAVLWLHG